MPRSPETEIYLAESAALDRGVALARRFATLVASLRGWRQLAIAIAAGAVSILAMAPFFLWPVLFVTLPILVWLMEGARQQSSPTAPLHRRLMTPAMVGWGFGFGYHVPGLYWLREAFAVTAGTLELLWPLAVLGLPAYLALFTALATASTALMPGSIVHRTLTLAVALAASEWLRGHVFTGFPWNVIGYALTSPLVLLQSASVLGIYGLTLMTVLICATPAVVLASAPARNTSSRVIGHAVLIAMLPLGLMIAFGAWRLSTPAPPPLAGPRLRLVQPSIPQRAKWQAEHQLEFFNRHIELSAINPAGVRDDLAGITHVIWPEAAMPFQPLRYPHILDAIGEALPDGVQLLAGLLRSEPLNAITGEGFRAFNSVAAFDDTGTPRAIYDKIHLVPFGEYLPFQQALEAIGLQSLTRQRGGFAIGAAPRPLLSIPGLPPVGILICYEAVFPAAVVQGSERPGLLLNITNDGWFGNSTGPRQHLQQARVRGVEEGIPLMRIANNGISAVFDAYGRELARLDLDTSGVIDTSVPATLQSTVYYKYKDVTAVVMSLVLLAAIFLTILRRN